MRPAAVLRLARVRHWIKNVIVLLPVAFGMKLGDPRAWLSAGLAMAAFSLAASGVYAINDVHDRQADRLHPRKRLRPVASGEISVAQALALGVLFLLAGGLLAGTINWMVLTLVAAYAALQACYTWWLKDKMLLDVMAIAAGFVLRAAGGALAIPVIVSPWLIICTFTLCLFMGFCKRRCEVGALTVADQAAGHRPVLRAYTPELLTHMITLSGAVAVVSMMLYASSSMTVTRFQTIGLVYTTPIFIYAIGRFAMLCIMGRYDDPTDLILRDRPFQMTVVLWLGAVIALILWGKPFFNWLRDVIGVG